MSGQLIERSRPPANAVLTHGRHVLSCAQGNVIVLLSLPTGSYHTLDEIGSRIWTAIGDGATAGEIVHKVLAECDEPDAQAADEIRAFLGELMARRFVDVDGPRRTQSGRPPRLMNPLANRPAVPSVATCVLLLAVISLALPVLGLERVWRRAHRRTVRYLQPLPVSYSGELARRATLAATLCPLRTQCLEQSLLVLWALRRAGADAHLRFGVQQYPFLAHAWVEHGGLPINDSVEALKLYRPFPLLDLGAR